MTIARVFFLMPLIPVLVLMHTLPFLPRRERLFGLAVPPEIRHGAQGAQLVGDYERRLLPWTIAAVLLGVFMPTAWLVAVPIAVPLVPLSGACRLFLKGRAAARAFALPASPIREALLTDAGDRIASRLLWFVPPLGILAAAALYLRANWDRIPERFAIHWDINGHANGWAHRSAGGVYAPLILAAFIILFLLAIAVVTHYGARRGTQQSATFAILTGVAYLMALVFSIAGLSPFWVPSPWVLFGLLGVFLCGVVILVIRAYSRPEPEGVTAEQTPEECWHAGDFYYNPNDPALFVEKRIGIGYTINFANHLSWVVLGATVLFVAGMVLLVPLLLRSH